MMRRTKPATSPPARSSTANQVGTVGDREVNEARVPSNRVIQTIPAVPPVLLDDSRGRELLKESEEGASTESEGGASMESEGGGHTAKDSEITTLTAKRKASPEDDQIDEGSSHSSPYSQSDLHKRIYQ